ncbi:hypothetical protein FB45DRAFT_1082451 [Roridomyces roridus]|uniref:Heme haloperoxidase family profile domain-containing protein n=1 Tax=Roridomyces roridus TaxID=1738132 RepID=A0AAD7BQ23_9AGAR|nr:hypothetical protein FB45DRAFT_1082451 [Roridomyces roridus]
MQLPTLLSLLFLYAVNARLEVRDGQTATLITFPATPTDLGLKRIPDDAHPFIAPGPHDQRGPGMNTLANHGYIPRNGIATFEEVVLGSVEVYGRYIVQKVFATSAQALFQITSDRVIDAVMALSWIDDPTRRWEEIHQSLMAWLKIEYHSTNGCFNQCPGEASNIGILGLVMGRELPNLEPERAFTFSSAFKRVRTPDFPGDNLSKIHGTCNFTCATPLQPESRHFDAPSCINTDHQTARTDPAHSETVFWLDKSDKNGGFRFNFAFAFERADSRPNAEPDFAFTFSNLLNLNAERGSGSDPAVALTAVMGGREVGRAHPTVRPCCEASKRPGGTRQTRHGRHDGSERQNYGLILGKPPELLQNQPEPPSGRLPMTHPKKLETCKGCHHVSAIKPTRQTNGTAQRSVEQQAAALRQWRHGTAGRSY